MIQKDETEESLFFHDLILQVLSCHGGGNVSSSAYFVSSFICQNVYVLPSTLA